MIVDQLSNAAFYFNMSERLAAALRFLQETDPSTLAPGRHDVQGADVYALVQHYESRPLEKGKWEAHRRYIDIQYLFEGEERMGYATLERAQLGEYDDAKDFQALQAEGDFITVRPGTFVIFAPQDAHMPNIAVTEPRANKKIVMKVRV